MTGGKLNLVFCIKMDALANGSTSWAWALCVAFVESSDEVRYWGFSMWHRCLTHAWVILLVSSIACFTYFALL